MVKIHSAGWSPEIIGKGWKGNSATNHTAKWFANSCCVFVRVVGGQVELWIDYTL